MKWNIVTDSSCDLFELEEKNENITYSSVPFTIQVGDKEYIDDAEMNTEEIFSEEKRTNTVGTTACPSSMAWMDTFEQEGNVIAVTISSELSGSYNSACVARDMYLEENPDKNIVVLDSHSAGPELIQIIRKLCELIENGYEFTRVIREINLYMKKIHIIFALSSFDHLVHNGRISKVVGMLATKLKMWGIGIASDEGKILVKSKIRGCEKMITSIIEDIKKNGVAGDSVVICHCHNEKIAEKLKESLRSAWESLDVKIYETRGLCSYYAEKGGLLISY